MKHDSAQAAAANLPDASSPEGTWFAKTRSGVQTWTLDELDLAFQRGDIDAATPVFTSGMTEWQTLGMIAGLDAPAANDTSASASATPPARSSLPTVVVAPARTLPPPPPRNFPPRTLPPPLTRADGGSFPPTSTAVFGKGASVWSSMAPADAEPQTGVRRNAALVPFAVRRSFGSVFDISSTLMARVRATHPRWAVVGPWLFGAALSGLFVFALYRFANAPMSPGAHTRSGPTVAYAAASPSSDADEPDTSPSQPSTTLMSATSPSNAAVTRRVPASPMAEREPLGTRLAAAALSNEEEDDGDPRSEAGAVLRTQDLQFAPSRSSRQATSSSRAKAKGKAWSKRSSKARARKARRSQRSHDFE